LTRLLKKNTEVSNLKIENSQLNMMLIEKGKQLDSLQKKNYIGQQIFDEINSLYPQILNCTFAESYIFSDSKANPEKVQIIVFKTKESTLKNSEKKKIEIWLKTRLKTTQIKVFYEI
jgi:hypothetical protein